MSNYISENYGLDLKVSDIARKFSLSHNTVINLFQKETGMTPSAFISRQRIQAAKSLSTNKLPYFSHTILGVMLWENLKKYMLST